MVTAGVYMVARLFPLFSLSEYAMGAVALIGALTAIFSALIALTQTDIKKVLAYSTVSQLGYMFVGVGAGAWSLGIYHVVTHAFFKALLFLGAGSVIHALSGEQDMRKMGGLRKKLPITFVTMFIGALALAGVPGTAGWCSKDQILGALLARAHHSHTFPYIWYTLYVLAALAALCTAFYTFRLIFVTFYGEERLTEESKAHLHESPPVMTVPLVILAFLAAFGGLIWWGLPGFLEPGHGEHHGATHYINLCVTLAATLIGIGWAYQRYMKRKLVPDPEESRSVAIKWSWNKFYIDDVIYTRVIGGLVAVGSEVLYLLVDVLLIDTLLVHGVGGVARLTGRFLRGLQTGLLNAYALGILGGVIVVLYWLLRGM
jgi:NADH-quinone oxidoreductase subunit L